MWLQLLREEEALTRAALQMEPALGDSLSLLSSSLFVVFRSSLTALCLSFPLYSSVSPSFSILITLSPILPSSPSLPPYIFLSGTHHLSSVVFLCHPLLPSPAHFHSSIQFKELYWHHKMNFTVSLSVSLLSNICLLQTNSTKLCRVPCRLVSIQ